MCTLITRDVTKYRQKLSVWSASTPVTSKVTHHSPLLSWVLRALMRKVRVPLGSQQAFTSLIRRTMWPVSCESSTKSLWNRSSTSNWMESAMVALSLRTIFTTHCMAKRWSRASKRDWYEPNSSSLTTLLRCSLILSIDSPTSLTQEAQAVKRQTIQTIVALKLVMGKRIKQTRANKRSSVRKKQCSQC